MVFLPWRELLFCFGGIYIQDHFCLLNTISVNGFKEGGVGTWFGHCVGHGLWHFVIYELHTLAGKEANLEKKEEWDRQLLFVNSKKEKTQTDCGYPLMGVQSTSGMFWSQPSAQLQSQSDSQPLNKTAQQTLHEFAQREHNSVLQSQLSTTYLQWI